VPAEGQRNFQLALQTTGLGQGMSAAITPDVITVTVAGPLPVLDNLGSDTITARVDLTDLTPGTYQLVPKIVLPTELKLIGVSPADVQVTVSSQ